MSETSIFGYDLVYSLSHFEKFKKLPPNNQAALLQSAQKFQDHPTAHFLSPAQLAEELGGSEKTWRQFLTLKPVRDYITKRTQEDVEIMHRQALAQQALKASKTGDNQAAKYIKELAEINAAETNRTTVILHYIPRPTPTEPSTNPQDDA